jgi:hypothetical protein
MIRTGEQNYRRGVLRLRSLLHLPGLEPARLVPLTPQTVDRIIPEQDRLVAAQLAKQRH